MDFQIKINGQRVETGEIEAVLCSTTGVEDALVILHGGGDTGVPKILVAYVVTQQTKEGEAAAQSAARLKLPRYMVPSAFVTLDAWPLNSAGKIDRKKLPAPDAAAATQGLRAPGEFRGGAETVVASVCAEVLGAMLRVPVGRFCAAGGAYCYTRPLGQLAAICAVHDTSSRRAAPSSRASRQSCARRGVRSTGGSR